MTQTRRKACPLCGTAAHPDHAPFCSRGCRDRDMLQWLGEGYRLPGPAIDPTDTDGLDRHDSRD
ncbi:DNA gyrase inhibitor YacG [Sphingomonas sp.]|uniref:DNA gyrase inhibitor YacG n=1 Tax=Sphingomonas sp. TaxID=28214 RepID=UPI002B7E20BD|nr:DNA gyrase inhibitor YacG [Sphingomonas sp.]HTG39748.1 DNA gyrase inhibitor YacG [Sphingomonas sp.]